MRKQLFLLLITLCAAVAVNAQSTHTSIMLRNHTELATPDVALNSSTQFHPNLAQAHFETFEYSGDRSSRRYESAVHKRNAGIVLTIIGTACLAGGGTLLALGSQGFDSDISGQSGYNISPLKYIGEILGGVVLSAAGLGMTIPGIINLAKGQHNMKKYKASQEVTP